MMFWKSATGTFGCFWAPGEANDPHGLSPHWLTRWTQEDAYENATDGASPSLDQTISASDASLNQQKRLEPRMAADSTGL
jgi:hypothetical protein